MRADWARGAGLLGACALAYLLLLTGPEPLDTLIQEDGVVETAGAAGFAVAAVCFLLAARAVRRRDGRDADRLRIVALVALGVAFVLSAGEEISWGQRIFGVGTPEGLARVNKQGETNLHNLDAFSGVLSADRLFQLFWFAVFVVGPLLCVAWPRARATIGRVLPAAPVWLAVVLGLNIALEKLAERAVRGGYESTYPLVQSGVEIKESLVGLLICLAAVLTLRAAARGKVVASSDT
jgi:hypothetical protein